MVTTADTITMHEPLYGLVELDAEGYVLYYNPEKDGTPALSRAEIVGQNFFTDVAKFDAVREFREKVNAFWLGHAPASSFNFTFDYKHAHYPVRILLARIHDHSEMGRRDSIFVHIRKA